jgi:ABC-type phosphate transport system permease subunit
MKKAKYIEEKIFRFLMVLSLILVAGFVFSVLWSIFSKGIPVLTWEMVTYCQDPASTLENKVVFSTPS